MDTETNPTTLSLTRKLADVMAAVERIPKRGYNEFHKYHYALEADIVEAIRQELAQRHVMLYPAVTAMQRDPVGEKGQVLTTLIMDMTFKDGESGEEITRPWVGAGTDKEDKGAYKAMTGGEKYFLLKTFLVPTGDDPEATEQPAATRIQRPPFTKVDQRAVAAAPPSGTFTRVKAIEEKHGTNARGAWTAYVVTFADGRKGGTFNSSLALFAETARDEGTPVDPILGPGKKPGTFELLSIDAVPIHAAVLLPDHAEAH